MPCVPLGTVGALCRNMRRIKIYVRAGEIFLLQKSHAICVLQVAFIGSGGDRYLWCNFTAP
jgi:hypothetical protein